MGAKVIFPHGETVKLSDVPPGLSRSVGARAYFSSPSWGDDDGAVGEELQGAAGGGFIDAADLGDGGDGDGFGGIAEGRDEVLEANGLVEPLEFEQSADTDDEGPLVRRAL
jgi:hypothetical protein